MLNSQFLSAFFHRHPPACTQLLNMRKSTTFFNTPNIFAKIFIHKQLLSFLTCAFQISFRTFSEIKYSKCVYILYFYIRFQRYTIFLHPRHLFPTSPPQTQTPPSPAQSAQEEHPDIPQQSQSPHI